MNLLLVRKERLNHYFIYEYQAQGQDIEFDVGG